MSSVSLTNMTSEGLCRLIDLSFSIYYTDYKIEGNIMVFCKLKHGDGF